MHHSTEPNRLTSELEELWLAERVAAYRGSLHVHVMYFLEFMTLEFWKLRI